MEPVSSVASILTLLAAAGSTCDFVYNFMLNIREVPEEIHSQAIKLRCLHQSIAALLAIYSHRAISPDLQLGHIFENSFREFLLEVKDLENRIQKSSTLVKSSRTQRVWERLTWLSSDRQLRKFYNSLDDWVRIFSMEVQTTQMSVTALIPMEKVSDRFRKLQINVLEISIQNAVSPPTPYPQQQLLPITQRPVDNIRMNIDTQPNTAVNSSNVSINGRAALSKSLIAHLSQLSEPIGLRIRSWVMLNLKLCSADIRIGPAVIRTWSGQGKAVLESASWRKGFYAVSTIQTKHLGKRRVCFTFSCFFKGSALCLNSKIDMHGMLWPTHPAYIACEQGNWNALRKLLEFKRVSLRDTSGLGDTLLHIAARCNHVEVLEGLLAEGSAVDAENDFGE
ncbi:hypothetical protein C7974DRAFT_409034 [Boeremia exigua]|uniref:uncharacterized protein n=1 Tax=Boeremia exigua TaxID=749465 RepID=UPI001E8DD63F|nr:uncharacterized protein C7974DRAFT_409034 [Boeremia exigua]KAH6642480.1 hypothetical protein C7974DRAFT_409034 [Boeremia exigua]